MFEIMVLTILIVFFTLVALLVLHELGHFIIAKKLGVKVEEFGLGYPPRLAGKKFGETLYSINLLPFGAFVKITGEEEKVKDSRSFSERSIWQRALIILGGVISFWLIAFLIFTLVAGTWGLSKAVSDDFEGEAQVQIVGVSGNSPAEIAGVRAGDTVLRGDSSETGVLEITKVKEFQEFINSQKGREVSLTFKRGKEIFALNLVPRISPPKEEGPIGVSLARVSRFKSPWYEAPGKGAIMTAEKTVQIPMVLTSLFQKFLRGEKVEGIQLVGPIGIGGLMSQFLKLGVDNFLLFIAIISVWLALFNLLPIPALDGGKILFLIIEGVRRKPVSEDVEQKITAFFFFCLILLMIFVTVRDIIRLL